MHDLPAANDCRIQMGMEMRVDFVSFPITFPPYQDDDMARL